MGGWEDGRVGGWVWEGGGAVNLHMHIVLHIHKHTLHFNSGIHIHVHEQSYYIVHYIRRKEEGKEGRKKRTNTDNLHQP